jgi:hypothetical protein
LRNSQPQPRGDNLHANLHIYGMHCAWRNQQCAQHVHADGDFLTNADPHTEPNRMLCRSGSEQQFELDLHTHPNTYALHNPQRGWAAC